MTINFTTLPNGLKICLKEVHTAPITSHWIWYRVGSRDEIPGKRGISHWVEHMLFKGTQKYPAGVLDKIISREGGVWNAMTNLDWTAYYQVMPSDKIDIVLELEADRMLDCVFDPDEVEAERTVILSEMEGSENEPLYRLGKAVQMAAFDLHPYRNEIIGEKEDLLSINQGDLLQHYRRYYTPQNALLAVAGDFETQALLERLEALYSGINGSERVTYPPFLEPPLMAERHVEEKGAGGTIFLQIAYRSPAATEKDFFVMSVLDSLLTGPSGLSMFGGGGISNRTSRLYRALVNNDYAVAVHGGLQATIDPYLYTITIVVHPDQTPDAVLHKLDEQVDLVQQNPVSHAEIYRAIKQARALFAYSTENITNQAFWLGYSEMFASYDWFLNYVEALNHTTPENILECAQTILHPSRRVVGIYRPSGEAGA